MLKSCAYDYIRLTNHFPREKESVSMHSLIIQSPSHIIIYLAHGTCQAPFYVLRIQGLTFFK